MVGGTGMVSNCESMAAMGQAPLVAVLADGARGTVVTLDAVGASRIELRKEKLGISAITMA
jgi:hypothetical protein